MMWRWLGIGLLLLGLQGCKQPEPFVATDITGSAIGGDFNLQDFNGQTRRLADFKGKLVVLFFGYTHCPDVCPVTLGELSTVRKRMGDDFRDVQVLFVSADPVRDTTAVLRQYVTYFSPDFLGLRAEGAELARFKANYKLVGEAQKPDANGNYAVDHSAASFVLDRQGRARLMVPLGHGTENWVHDLKLLLAE